MELGLIAALCAFAFGGVLKGAIGAGTPIIVIPIMSLFYGVPFAVAVFVVTAVLANIWQIWVYRAELLPAAFIVRLTISAGVGAAVGSFMLASLPSDFLMTCVAILALAYVVFRLARPEWKLAYDAAVRLALPVGFVSGVLQGAAGISASVSVTFINALGLERRAFIATISAFFLAMSLVQLPLLVGLGVLDMERFLIGLVACIPMFGAMPVGVWLARFIPRIVFDRVVLGLLIVISVRLFWNVL